MTASISIPQCVCASVSPSCTTDIIQRELGMVNNRVFEVLMCGAVLISDCFPALEEAVKGHVLCVHKPGDITAHLR